MKAVMFRPIPMKAWGPSLGSAQATLGQGDDDLIANIEHLEDMLLNFDIDANREGVNISRECRGLVNSIPPVPDAGWADAWAAANDCIGRLSTYVDEQTIIVDSEMPEPGKAPPGSRDILGLDPMVFWGGSAVAGVLLIASLTGAFK